MVELREERNETYADVVPPVTRVDVAGGTTELSFG